MKHRYTAVIRNYTLKNIPVIIRIDSDTFRSVHYNHLVSELQQLAFDGCDYDNLEARVYKDSNREPFLTIKCVTENDGFRIWTTVSVNGDVIRKITIAD